MLPIHPPSNCEVWGFAIHTLPEQLSLWASCWCWVDSMRTKLLHWLGQHHLSAAFYSHTEALDFRQCLIELNYWSVIDWLIRLNFTLYFYSPVYWSPTCSIINELIRVEWWCKVRKAAGLRWGQGQCIGLSMSGQGKVTLMDHWRLKLLIIQPFSHKAFLACIEYILKHYFRNLISEYDTARILMWKHFMLPFVWLGRLIDLYILNLARWMK